MPREDSRLTVILPDGMFFIGRVSILWISTVKYRELRFEIILITETHGTSLVVVSKKLVGTRIGMLEKKSSSFGRRTLRAQLQAEK